MKRFRSLYPIFILLVIAFFFRLWKLSTFQYWSDDEQLLWSIIRHIIIDKHLSLVTPNVAVGVGLGPLFHYLLVPWFWLVKLDPQKVLLLGNIFALGSLIAIYKLGETVGGKKVAFIAGFLYASSFMSSLFDRRLWALSPNPLLISLGILALTKIVKGNSKYLLLLSLPIVFSVNSDPSLGVIVLASFLAFIIFKPKLERKYVICSLFLLLILLSPLIIFEIRHQGQNIKSLSQNLFQITSRAKPIEFSSQSFLLSQVKNFSRFFFAESTKSADAFFCYCTLDDTVPTIIIVTVVLILTAFIYISLHEKNKSYFILLLMLVSYLFGIFIFKTAFMGNPAFFYSLTVSPVIFLITAAVISRVKYLALFLLPIMLLTNINSLFNSDFKYPLKQKMEIVRKTVSKIPDPSNFSLYYSGDILLAGGGWTSLFVEEGYTPSIGSLSRYWGHVYESYNLYPTPFSLKEPKTVVILSEKEYKDIDSTLVVDSIHVGNTLSIIYNNTNGWFHPDSSIEKLYQPKYFK